MNWLMIAFSNWRNIIILILAVLLALLGISAFYYKNRTETLAGKVKESEAVLQAQAEIIEQNARVITAIKAHDARIRELSVETGKINEAIRTIKIEGRCVKDEKYYTVIDGISARFNGVRKDGN